MTPPISRPASETRKLVVAELYPFALGVLAAIFVACVMRRGHAVPADLSQLFASTVDVGAIAVGFLATVKALLLTLAGGRHRFAQQLGLFRTLQRYLRWAIGTCFVLAALSLVMVLLEKGIDDPTHRQWLLGTWCAAVVTAGATVWRALSMFFQYMSEADKQPHEPAK